MVGNNLQQSEQAHSLWSGPYYLSKAPCYVTREITYQCPHDKFVLRDEPFTIRIATKYSSPPNLGGVGVVGQG